MRKKTKTLTIILGFLAIALSGLLYYRFFYYPTLGNFGVITTPDDARVLVDGEYIGNSPLEFTRREGTYQLRIEKDGFDMHEQEITVPVSGFDIVGVLLQESE